MPTNIVPNAIPRIVTTLPAPNDGEIANSASLTQFVTPLVDDVEAYRLLLYGGGMRRRVLGLDSTTMTIYPLGAVLLQTGGTWKAYAHTVSTAVNPTTLAGGALVASTRYWVYAYDNAGALAFTASTTGPDAGLRYMTGNTAYFLVTTFWTNAAASLVPYSQAGDTYTYTDAPLGAGTRLLNGGLANVDTDVPLVGGPIPSQASRADLLIAMVAAAGQYRAFVKAGAAASPKQYVAIVLQDNYGVGVVAQGVVDCLASGGVICYSVTAGGPATSIFAMGFTL
jgi:hypothetical protein